MFLRFLLTPAKLLRKYVSYARKYVYPTLSPGACEEIQRFYMDLRERHQNVDSTPITTRQLESVSAGPCVPVLYLASYLFPVRLSH